MVLSCFTPLLQRFSVLLYKGDIGALHVNLEVNRAGLNTLLFAYSLSFGSLRSSEQRTGTPLINAFVVAWFW